MGRSCVEETKSFVVKIVLQDDPKGKRPLGRPRSSTVSREMWQIFNPGYRLAYTSGKSKWFGTVVMFGCLVQKAVYKKKKENMRGCVYGADFQSTTALIKRRNSYVRLLLLFENTIVYLTRKKYIFDET